jgi:hypothetical protein
MTLRIKNFEGKRHSIYKDEAKYIYEMRGNFKIRGCPLQPKYCRKGASPKV